MSGRQKILVGIFVAVVLIACVYLVYFLKAGKNRQTATENSVQKQAANQQADIQQQLKDLEEIRSKQEAAAPQQTTEQQQADVQQQLKQLDDMRKADSTPAPTQQDVQSQLDQLNASRSKTK